MCNSSEGTHSWVILSLFWMGQNQAIKRCVWLITYIKEKRRIQQASGYCCITQMQIQSKFGSELDELLVSVVPNKAQVKIWLNSDILCPKYCGTAVQTRAELFSFTAMQSFQFPPPPVSAQLAHLIKLKLYNSYKSAKKNIRRVDIPGRKESSVRQINLDP